MTTVRRRAVVGLCCAAVALPMLGATMGAAAGGGGSATPGGDGWLRALMIRSDALNRIHGLGEYAKDADPRSAALNARYGLDR